MSERRRGKRQGWERETGMGKRERETGMGEKDRKRDKSERERKIGRKTGWGKEIQGR